MDYTFSNSQPIWMQLTDILTERIVTGVYPAGERIPTVREFAAAFGVNPNTMQRALTQLEADGLVCTNRTVGRSVTQDDAAIQKTRRRLAQAKIDAYLSGMAQLGFSKEEAAALLAEDASGESQK